MEAQSNLQEIADRYIRYIGELREFFGVERLAFGAPECLPPVCSRLQEDEVFRQELGSMARSVLFREGGAVAVTDLLSLLLVSIAGPRIEDEADAYRAQVASLLRFLTSVLRAPVNQPRDSVPVSPTPAQPETPKPFEAPAVPVTEAAPKVSLLPSDPLHLRPNWRRLWQRWWWAPPTATAGAIFLGMAFMPRPTSAPEPHGELSTIQPEPAKTPQSKPTAAIGTSDASPSHPSSAPATARSAPENKDISASGIAATPAPSDSPAAPALPRDRETSSERTAGGASEPVSRPEVRPLTPTRHPVSAVATRWGIMEVSSGVMSANLIAATPPTYPRVASVVHLQGEVILQAFIARDGHVEATHVLSGHYLLRGAAVQAVRKWRYRPYTMSGRPVDVSTVINVNFRLPH